MTQLIYFIQLNIIRARVSDSAVSTKNVRRANMNEQTKTCSKETCGMLNPQPISNFRSQKKGKYGVTSWCKSCDRKYHASRYVEKRDSILELSAAYYANNQEKVQRRHKEWRDANKEYIAAYIKKYSAERPWVNNEKCRRYYASKLNATPSWLSEDQITQMVEIYRTCPEGYEVDHIVPLQGKTVTGLHVPWNLQHLSISDNRRKSNKY